MWISRWPRVLVDCTFYPSGFIFGFTTWERSFEINTERAKLGRVNLLHQRTHGYRMVWNFSLVCINVTICHNSATWQLASLCTHSRVHVKFETKPNKSKRIKTKRSQSKRNQKFGYFRSVSFRFQSKWNETKRNNIEKSFRFVRLHFVSFRTLKVPLIVCQSDQLIKALSIISSL